ncbi:plasmid partition protein ParA (plasmid) [Salinibacter ruber M8]|uniref:Plasmid partition protein ParA n=1 Tax=Salinibacter ruber (strain M8) TaxID=761659 RepID=D5H476_SALRM|nr:ParA family partition ATPase [Salinibacter ruber]CBH22716.1 plasmid partition protein ParA [Salinibacter ruber M8]
MPDRPSTDALVIAVQNPKGGCGKTTIAVNLARAVQLDGFDVVILDTDEQGSARDWRARSPSGYDGPRVERATSAGKLGRLVERHAEGADAVVIDGSARLGKHTGAVVAVADVLLIPVQPSALDLWGTVEFMNTVEDASEELPVRPAFVASRRDPRTNLSEQVSDALQVYDFPVLQGTAQRVAYAYSVQDGRTVLDGYDDKAAGEVRQLLEETAEIAAQ